HPLWPLSLLSVSPSTLSLFSSLSPLSSLSLLSFLFLPCLFPFLLTLSYPPDSHLFLFVCSSHLFSPLGHLHTNRLRSAGFTQDLPFSSTEYYHHRHQYYYYTLDRFLSYLSSI